MKCSLALRILFLSISYCLLFTYVLLPDIALVAQSLPSCTGVCALAWSPIDETLLAAVDNTGLWLYDVISQGDPLFFPYPNATSLSFDPEGHRIAVTSCGGADAYRCEGRLSLFDIEDQSWEQLAVRSYPIGNAKFSPDGRYIAVESDEIGASGIQLINMDNRETISIVDSQLTDLVIDYAFDPQSSLIAISNGNYGYEGHSFWGISVWRISEQSLQAVTEHGVMAASVMFAQATDEIRFVMYDTQLSVWNYHTGVISFMRRFFDQRANNPLNSLSFAYHPDYLVGVMDRIRSRAGRVLGDQLLSVWDIQSGETIFSISVPASTVMNRIAVNRTGEYYAFSSTSNEQKILGVWSQSTQSVHNISLIP